MVISSGGTMQALTTPAPRSWAMTSAIDGAIGVGGYAATYATIYRTQPNVRICVEFLARNIAQLGIHVFRRVSDVDRMRLADHALAGWLEHPIPATATTSATTRYRLIESLLCDLGIYWNAFWLKLRYDDDARRRQVALVRLPPYQVQVTGGLLPHEIVWTPDDGQPRHFKPIDVCHFGGYHPTNPLVGLSPMETLRQTLSEVYHSAEYRSSFWQNSARFDGIIERPAGGRWAPEARQQFRESWQAGYGRNGSNRGGTPVLEDGMKFVQTTANAKDAEYVASIKLAREVCAASYHIPPPMVGILEHATFSNIKEQHKQLYADTLGPWLAFLKGEIEAQLLPEADDVDDVYVEFNIAEKLRGSFEEQADALQKMIGRPMMTVNEGRARLNLPAIDDPEANQLAAQPGTGDSNQRALDVDAAAFVAQLRALETARAPRDRGPVVLQFVTPTPLTPPAALLPETTDGAVAAR